jgi:sec-independent protein translocase protein TatA
MARLPSIGLPELLVVLAVALAIFGGSRLPEVGRDLGRALRGFRAALTKESAGTDGADPPTTDAR